MPNRKNLSYGLTVISKGCERGVGRKQEQAICEHLKEQETSWNTDETVEMSPVQ